MTRNFFLSYSRADKDRLGHLLRGLDRLHHHVWMDEQLEGGQQWWDEVLGQIRGADAMIIALSPAALESTACLLEFRYAAALGRPVVPVMIEPFNPDLLPSELARVQLVDFTTGNEQAPFDLMAALSGWQIPRRCQRSCPKRLRSRSPTCPAWARASNNPACRWTNSMRRCASSRAGSNGLVNATR